MKPHVYSLLAIVTVGGLALGSLAVNPPRGGTDILHFTARDRLANAGVLSDAGGSVSASQNQQGHANNQRLDIAATKLETNAPYQLYALLGDDTNYTFVTDFTSSVSGNAKLRYMKVGSSRGRGAALGKNALPAVLDPLSEVRGLAIANASTQAVLTADLTAPDKLEYLIKRSLAEGAVLGQLRLHATTRALQFRLLAWGLAPGANYFLVANGDVVGSGNADTNGFLRFTQLPVSPADILQLRTLGLWDSASNSVLNTQLP